MCELLAVNVSDKLLLNDLLRSFFANADEHPNGWGMAFFYGNAVSLEKQPCNALKSAYLRERLQARIETDKMMAHIRLATKGSMEYVNTHPFVMRDSSGRAWTLAHNGTIFECDVLNHYVHTQQGQSDSERVLMYVIDRINAEQLSAGRNLSAQERFRVIEKITAEISPENKLNYLLYDGELLYAHMNYKGSLHYCMRGGTVLISTRPLDSRDWREMPLNTVLAFQDGRLRFTGHDHGNEFFFSEEKWRLLFLDFAAL